MRKERTFIVYLDGAMNVYCPCSTPSAAGRRHVPCYIGLQHCERGLTWPSSDVYSSSRIQLIESIMVLRLRAILVSSWTLDVDPSPCVAQVIEPLI